jgi:hypothetical protein
MDARGIEFKKMKERRSKGVPPFEESKTTSEAISSRFNDLCFSGCDNRAGRAHDPQMWAAVLRKDHTAGRQSHCGKADALLSPPRFFGTGTP